MITPTRHIKRPALLGVVAAVALTAAIAASWSLAAQASALREAREYGAPGLVQAKPES